MGQAIPRQHPAVVLRSHYRTVVALLCVAVVAIVALAAAVVVVASGDDSTTVSAQPSAQSAQPQQTLPPGARFDGGPDEGSRGPDSYLQNAFKSRAGGPSPLVGHNQPGAHP